VALCPLPLWEALARQDSSATFFQTPAWLRLAAAHARGAGRSAEIAPLLFEFTRAGETVQACLPLLRDRRWGRLRYFSPFGTYSALVCPRVLDDGERARVEARLASLNLHAAGSPFTRNPLPGARLTRLPARTQWIDLTPAHAESPARDWAPDPRRRLRIARENGVTVRAAGSPADWDDYHGLYLKSLRRWGTGATSVYPRALFEALRAAAEAPETQGKIRLWLAGHEGKAAAGYIAFYHNDHACIWHGAADEAYFKLGATQLLYHDMIADAAGRGFPAFDLMGSGGLAALEAFKASLGARTVEYDGALNRTGLVGLLAGLRDRFSRGPHNTR
jgi:CelD/BcsL family acetyltransferase involved in cellulose biosynthesis